MLDLICGVSNYVGKAAENTLAVLNDLDILTEKAINNLNNNINLKSKEEEMYLRVLLDAINDLIENHWFFMHGFSIKKVLNRWIQNYF